MDGNLRRLFRQNLPEFFWTSVETFTEPGVPDSFYCKSGVSGWVEFKQTTSCKIKSLTQEQVNWHARLRRKGGRSFFAVRRGEALYLFGNNAAEELKEKGVASSCLGQWQRPWPWNQIGMILTS